MARRGGCARRRTAHAARHRRPPPDTKSILVVGAGMAGLAAARSLADAGWPVRVIEARDRIGGRVYTNRDWGVPLEMGASWIQGTKQPADGAGAERSGAARPDRLLRAGRSSRLIPDCNHWTTTRRPGASSSSGPATRSMAEAWAPPSTRRPTAKSFPAPSAPSWLSTSPPRSRTNTPPTRTSSPPRHSTGRIHRRRPGRHHQRLRRPAEAARQRTSDRPQYAGHRCHAARQAPSSCGRGTSRSRAPPRSSPFRSGC